MKAPEPPCLLAVFAHPDDETLLAGPLLAKCAAEGVAVHLVCATSQEAPGIPAERRAALGRAAKVLGIRHVELLGYGDDIASPGATALSEVKAGEIARRLEGILGRVRPDVVLTDSAYGGYGHPHHILIHQATLRAVRAYRAAADVRLYALAYGRPIELGMATVARMRRRFVPADPVASVAPVMRGARVDARIDVSKFIATRKKAAQEYRAEIMKGPLLFRAMEAGPAGMQRILLGTCRLTRVLPPGEGHTIESELFPKAGRVGG